MRGWLGLAIVDENLDAPDFPEHEHEDALEPRHLIRRSNVVLRAGIMMLGAGTSGLRVREVMSAVARTVGIRRIRAQVTFTDITLTVFRRNAFRTQVSEIPAPGVDANRIALLQDFARDLPERATVAEVDAKLDAIEQQPKLYSLWLLVPLVGLACAAVTLLTNGGWREAVAVFIASALAFRLNRALTRLQFNHLAVVLLSAAVATGGYLLLTRMLDAGLGGPSNRMAAGLVCAAIFLIPGFPLVTAGLDLARIDLMAGVPRMAYAAMVLLALTIGVWMAVTISGASPDPVPVLDGPAPLVWAVLLAASFAAVFGWATMFNSPLRMAVTAGVAAALGNIPRLLLLEAGVKLHVATFVGTFVMGLLCALAERWFGYNKIIMTVPTVLVTIPGSAALRTLIYFDQADVTRAVENGVATALAAIAMVAGLAAARMLTDPEWAFTRPEAGGSWYVGRWFQRQ